MRLGGWMRASLVGVLCVLVQAEEQTHHGPQIPHQAAGHHNEEYDHLSVLGSESMNEEFERMAPEVARSQLQKMVQTHDQNGDGYITKKEMYSWITNSFQKLDHDEAMEKFEEEDVDHDGKVTWQEYLDKAHRFSTHDVEQMRVKVKAEGDKTEEGKEASTNLKMVDDDGEFFRAADLDKDGALSKDEYLAFYFPPSHPHMHAVEMQRYMRETDHDKDGKISPSEFSPGQTEDAESRAAAMENFGQFDSNKDGFLSVEEARLWVVPPQDEQVQTEVDHLLRLADQDGDGKLSMKEILDKTHEFVGSSITDYGNLLDGDHDEL